jgi:hypothetical protein
LFIISCLDTPTVLDGELVMLGNEPFSRLAVQNKGKEVYLDLADQKKYKHLQGKNVRVWGVVSEHSMSTADGRYKVTEYKIQLDSLKVIQ